MQIRKSHALQAKMSKGCRFLLFWHHSYQVTLTLCSIFNVSYRFSDVVHILSDTKIILTLLFGIVHSLPCPIISSNMIMPEHWYACCLSPCIVQLTLLINSTFTMNAAAYSYLRERSLFMTWGVGDLAAGMR